MQVKLFELRDKATFIPIVAIKIIPATIPELYLHRRVGFRVDDKPVMISRLAGGDELMLERYDRTFAVALEHITDHFDTLTSGDVIDVEFILGETTEKKVSERFTT